MVTGFDLTSRTPTNGRCRKKLRRRSRHRLGQKTAAPGIPTAGAGTGADKVDSAIALSRRADAGPGRRRRTRPHDGPPPAAFQYVASPDKAKALHEGAAVKRERPVIGWREWVELPELLGLPIKAKIDSGARTSSIHSFGTRRFHDGGAPWVEFLLHPIQRHARPEMERQRGG